MMKKCLILILMLLALSACSKSVDSLVPTATPNSAPNATQASSPVLPAATSVSAASPTPFTSFTVKPTVDNLNVRTNPGYLFDALMMVHQADTVTVLATAPGHEWTYIQTQGGVEGWVFTQLLQSSVDLTQIPLREPKDAQLIKGRVTDASGAPIRGVGFNFAPSGQSDSPNNTVTTDINGDFYSYLPTSASGAWTVSYTAIACESNVWSDNTCSTYKTGYSGNVDPQTISITLPQSAILTFTWK